MKNEEQKVLEKIARNDKTSLDEMYLKFRDPFFNYFKRYSISDDEIKDLYQDTMIAFYQKGVQGKLDNISSSLKTYVFGIGKYKVIDAIRKKGKEMVTQDSGDTYEVIEIDKPELTTQQKRLLKGFDKLGESCQKMLKMFYYRGLDISEIAEIGGYKDSNSVKSHKSRCLKQLRTMVNK